MNNTPPADGRTRRFRAGALAAAVGLTAAFDLPVHAQGNAHVTATAQSLAESPASLSARQAAIVPIAAFAAAGDIARLNAALEQGLDAGMTVSDAKEVLIQLYAYAGFPRSLNALSELMKVLQAREQRGVRDAPGAEPIRPIPQGAALLAAGTANQTKLSGGPVQGPLFDFAPLACARTSLAISSNATTWTGKAARSPQSACWPQWKAWSRNCRRTCGSA